MTGTTKLIPKVCHY
nr:unnamed protein product [Callosobruchus analis]